MLVNQKAIKSEYVSFEFEHICNAMSIFNCLLLFKVIEKD